MDIDVEGNDFIRIPTSSSSFFALATLRPPSPTPSPIILSSLVSFDEIPIFLWDSAVESYGNLMDLNGNSISRGSKSFSRDKSVDSFVSICSFGTFGPKRFLPGFENRADKMGHIEDGLLSKRDSIEQKMRAIFISQPEISSRTCLRNTFEERFRYVDDSLSQPRASMKVSIAVPRTIQSCETPVAPRYQIGALSEAETTSRARAEYKTVTRERNLTEPLKSHRSRSRNIPSLKYLPTYTEPVASQPIPSNQPPSEPSQTEFAWLRNITIDFLIDQEGFRSASPSFKYSGVKHGPKNEDVISVQFRPLSKQIFYFHYNPFDSSPILRRVTVHGEETRDYISKQAHLSMKSNGIYSVNGTELCSVSLLHSGALKLLDHDRDSRLQWQFHYMVDDRLDTFGRVIDGEKKIVPLTFTCSPWLLHPSQGKRINLMHVFKKGIVTKLTAERFRPPVGSRQLSITPATCMDSNIAVKNIVKKNENEQISSIRHRRVQSHALHQAVNDSEHGVDYVGGYPKLRKDISPFMLRRRRRASSAGENSTSLEPVTPSLLPHMCSTVKNVKHSIPSHPVVLEDCSDIDPLQHPDHTPLSLKLGPGRH